MLLAITCSLPSNLFPLIVISCASLLLPFYLIIFFFLLLKKNTTWEGRIFFVFFSFSFWYKSKRMREWERVNEKKIHECSLKYQITNMRNMFFQQKQQEREEREERKKTERIFRAFLEREMERWDESMQIMEILFELVGGKNGKCALLFFLLYKDEFLFACR